MASLRRSNLGPGPAGRRSGWRFAVPAALIVLVIVAVCVAARSGGGQNRSIPRRAHFVPGQRRVYKVDFGSAGASDFSAIFSEPAPGMQHVFELNLRGELAVTVLEADANHTSILYQFRGPQVQFQAEGQDAPAQSRTIEADLARPVLGLLDGHGKVLSVRFDAATAPLSQNVVRTLLAATQFVGPASEAAPGPDWETEEDDANGTLIAKYQVQADGDVHKSKVRYLQPKPQKRRGKTVVLAPDLKSDGEYVMTLDSDGCLTALSAEDAQSISIRNQVVGQGTLNLEMRLLRKEECDRAEAAALRAAADEFAKTALPVSLCVVRSPEEGWLDIQRQELGSATIDSLLADLAAAETVPEQAQDYTRLFLKFKALAIVKPESCTRLGELLTTAEVGSLKMRVLADSLEAAGNAKAQAALGKAIRGRAGDEPALARLIPALGAAESPTLETERTLLSLAFETYDAMPPRRPGWPWATPCGAWRRVAGSGGKDRRALAERAGGRRFRGRAMAAAIGPGQRRFVHALPALTRCLDDPSPVLRGAAAWALRWIDSPEADRLLTAKVLLGDGDPECARRFAPSTSAGCRPRTSRPRKMPWPRRPRPASAWSCFAIFGMRKSDSRASHSSNRPPPPTRLRRSAKPRPGCWQVRRLLRQSKGLMDEGDLGMAD